MTIKIPKNAKIKTVYSNWKTDPAFLKIFDFIKQLNEDEFGFANIGEFSWKDYEALGYLTHSDDNVESGTANRAVRHAIEVFGEIPSMPLYRGCSDKEKEQILKAKTSILAYSFSFSEKKEIASKFGNNIITVRKCSKPIFNYSKFLSYCEIANEILDPGYIDSIDSNEDSNEFEWLIPAKTKFKVIDKNKLLFEV